MPTRKSDGARKVLQAAIENEVIEYIQFHKVPGMKMGSDWWYEMVTFRNGKSPADYFFIDE